MKTRPLAALCASLAILAACATSTPYQPADGGRYGYSERQVESDRWLLTFAGNSSTDRATVESYLLYRAAEITDQNGFDIFRIVRRDVDTESRFVTQGDTFGGGFGYYRRGFGGFASFSTRERQSFEAIAEIQLDRGEPADDDLTAFVADDVLTTLSGQVRRPS